MFYSIHFKVLTTLSLLSIAPLHASEPINVVTTLPDYAAIAREIGGDTVDVQSIITGPADAHFIKPKPSYALMLRKADLFVSTGLDLELWVPVLVRKSGNRKILDGAPGYVAAAQGLELLDKPLVLDRSAGDIHAFGNPHVHTSPIHAGRLAHNITVGLCRVNPSACSHYQNNLQDFKDQLSIRLYGQALTDLLEPEILDSLAEKNKLIQFLREQNLLPKLGGWLGQALPLRDTKVICYHKNWIYFTTLFGLDVVDYVEAKPGIPPTARHVSHLITTIKEHDIPLLLAANYFEKRKPQLIADRTGIRPVVVPLSVQGEPGVDSLFDLYDLWISRLLAELP